MDTYTMSEATKKAKEISAPLEEKARKRVKFVFNNAATFISAFIILLSIILFAYNKGYSHIYHIPIECMPLELRSYMPVALHVTGIMLTILYYIIEFKVEYAIGRKRINLLRVFWGHLILWHILVFNHINTYWGMPLLYIISIALSLIIELIIFWLNKPKRSVNEDIIDKKTFYMKVEDFTFFNLIYTYGIRFGLFILIIATTVAPILGKISAKSKLDYQICNYNDSQYAIIVDYNDRVLVQPAKTNKNKLIISTDHYVFLSKDNIEIIYKEFDSVSIIDNILDKTAS